MHIKYYIFITIFVVNGIALGKDFGQRGTIFEIAEEGFVTMMKRKLSVINLVEQEEKMKEIARKRVESPVAVVGVTRTKEDKEFYYDPTYILPEDINLPCGKVLYKAGIRVNPLDHMDFTRRLYFIDGRDEEQIEWLKEQFAFKQESKPDYEIPKGSKNFISQIIESRIILTGGKIFELQSEFGEVLYFDQAGELTSKFRIGGVPAIVEQEGKMLRIREINISE